VVADLVPGSPGLEVAAASRATLHLWSAAGVPIAPFPVTWRDELRSLAAGEIDGDAALELVVATTSRLEANGQRDLLMAYDVTGDVVAGFPPNTTGASGCVTDCNITGGFDQNLALGDLDGNGGDGGDGIADIVAPHDNAYLSIHDQDGFMFDAAPVYPVDDKVAGIRFLFDLALAQQGFPSNPPVDNQAHFTNSAPAIADLDGDGTNELVLLGSAQNASQTDRLRGVGLWLLGPDGARKPGWEAPLHLPAYLSGLWDPGGNIVGMTNQVSIGDLDSPSLGLEIVFAGFDGRIYAVRRDRTIAWSYAYTTDASVMTGGVALADLGRRTPGGDLQYLFDRQRQGEAVRAVRTRAAASDLPPRSRRDAGADGGRRRWQRHARNRREPQGRCRPRAAASRLHGAGLGGELSSLAHRARQLPAQRLLRLPPGRPAVRRWLLELKRTVAPLRYRLSVPSCGVRRRRGPRRARSNRAENRLAPAWAWALPRPGRIPVLFQRRGATSGWILS
jgi:hypothetical protein